MYVYGDVFRGREHIFRNSSLEQDPVFTSGGDQAAPWFHRVSDVQENSFFSFHTEEQAGNAQLILKIKREKKERGKERKGEGNLYRPLVLEP